MRALTHFVDTGLSFMEIISFTFLSSKIGLTSFAIPRITKVSNRAVETPQEPPARADRAAALVEQDQQVPAILRARANQLKINRISTCVQPRLYLKST